jgi:N-methylhydantoinase B
MKFSENGLYVERYIKCGTCGALIYDKQDRRSLTHDGINYCSQWCIDWKKSVWHAARIYVSRLNNIQKVHRAASVPEFTWVDLSAYRDFFGHRTNLARRKKTHSWSFPATGAHSESTQLRWQHSAEMSVNFLRNKPECRR